jgi:membrane fusion protein (multidrug efflux system)
MLPLRHRTSGPLALLIAVCLWAVPLQAQQPTPVEVYTVQTERIVETIDAVGSLRAAQSITVRPEISGVITEIHFDEGEPVDAGAQLFSLEDSIYRAELAQAEASLRLSSRNYERARELSQRSVGSDRARDEAFSNLEVDRASVELAKARLEKTGIVAPFAGVTGLRQVDLGEYVDGGDALVTLDEIDTLEIDFEIAERYLRFVHVGQGIKIQVDAFPGESFEGRVQAISPRINPAGRSIAIRGELANEGRKLKPGMFARVGLVIDKRDAAVVIPEQAIVPQGDKFFVFTVIDGAAKQTEVKIGLREYGRVEIVDGLAEGDQVIVAGQIKIRDGSPVAPRETDG